MSSIISKEPVLVKILNGSVISQSDVLAKEFGKNHKDILKKIRVQIKMLVKLRHQINEYFIESDRIDKRGKTYERYDLTYEGFQLVALSLTGEEAFEYKVRFIKQYKDLLKIVVENELTSKMNKKDGVWVEVRKEEITSRDKLTDAIQDYELPQRKKEGKGDINFVTTRIMNYTIMIKKILGFDIPKGTEPRDVLNASQLIILSQMERKVAKMIEKSDRHYKQTYQWIKEELIKEQELLS